MVNPSKFQGIIFDKKNKCHTDSLLIVIIPHMNIFGNLLEKTQ